MTISDVSNVKTYTGNGVTTAYSTVFSFYESTDLIVKVSGSVTTAYTVTGGNGAVGTVTFTSAPASSAPIIIERLVAYEQQSDFVNYDGNPADVTEKQFDLLAMQCQQLRDSIERSVTVPVGTTGFDPEVTVTGNGGKFLQLKTDLSGFAFSNTIDLGELTVSDYIETLLDDTDVATARATLGLGSIATKDISFTASKQGAILMQNSTDDGFVFLNSQGTSGQVLTSAGADAPPTWSTGTSLVLLSTQTASASADIQFTSGITSAYKKYIIDVINHIPATDATSLYMRMSLDGGSTYGGASDYSYNNITLIELGGVVASSDNANSFIHLTGGSGVGNASGEGLCARIEIFNPAGTTMQKNVSFHTSLINESSALVTIIGSGRLKSNSAVNAIQLYSASGNITSGTFKLYGVL